MGHVTWKHFERARRTALFAAIAAIGIACGPPAATIDGPAARALVSEGATLLDVRTDGEWGRGHLEGAVHVPVDALASRLADVPRDRPVVVYCASGARSARAAEVLRAAGYDARDLGGMARWND